MATFAKITNMALETGTDNSYYISWSFVGSDADRGHLKEFYIQWHYSPETSGSLWFEGRTETVSTGSPYNSTYSPPENAQRIRARVKAIAKDNESFSSTSNYTAFSDATMIIDVDDGGAAGIYIKQLKIELQEGSNNNYFASWVFNNTLTDKWRHATNYTAEWWYETTSGSNVWFEGSTENVELGGGISSIRRSFFTPPDNARRLRVRVKVNPQTYIISGREVNYYNTTWSSFVFYSLPLDNTPETPDAPSIEINGDILSFAAYTNDENVNRIRIQVYRVALSSEAKGSNVKSQNYIVSDVFRGISDNIDITPLGGRGREYRIRCRAEIYSNGKQVAVSEWSSFSEAIGTAPAKLRITKLITLTPTSVQVHFDYDGNLNNKNERVDKPTVLETAESYILQWSTSQGYFDSSNVYSDEIDATTGIKDIEERDLETGQVWYFRIRAVANDKVSEWSNIASVILGTRPNAPTTWSDLSTISIDVSSEPNMVTVVESDYSSMITNDANYNTVTNGERVIKANETQLYLPFTKLLARCDRGFLNVGDTLYYRFSSRCGSNHDNNVKLVIYGYQNNGDNSWLLVQSATGEVIIKPTSESGTYSTIIGELLLGGSGWDTVDAYRIAIKDERSTKSQIYVKQARIYKEDKKTIANRLYWAHNSEDGSGQTNGLIEFTRSAVNGENSITWTENFNPVTQSSTALTVGRTFVSGNGTIYPMFPLYSIDDTDYTLSWRVRTLGALPTIMVDGQEEIAYSPWSVLRTMRIYAKPDLTITVPDVVRQFPLNIRLTPMPTVRTLIGYTITITLNRRISSGPSYSEVINDNGELISYRARDVAYTKYVNVMQAGGTTITSSLGAGDIYLINGWEYKVTVVGAFDNGLTASGSALFTVDWANVVRYYPNGSVTINDEDYSALINLDCTGQGGASVNQNAVTMSVYRRESDGSFTELVKDLTSWKNATITDLHPSLNLVNYRIVASEVLTGTHNYIDLASVAVNANCVVLQWDEMNEPYVNESASRPSSIPVKGIVLKLPWNVDVSDSFSPETSLINYIGREYPVSYYGTQKGVTSTWNVVIRSDDIETLYLIRKLAVWMGDVYVREPSGSSYWANISVSYSLTHGAVTIPISFSVKRVEGD